MPEEYTKTLPVPGTVDAPYWEHLQRHEVVVQHCADCGAKQWYPREMCHRCNSVSLEWAPVEPVGEVYTFSVQHQKTGSRFDDDIPYAVVVVALRDEPDVRLVGRLVGAPADAVEIGTPVEGEFLDATPDVTLLNWRIR